MKTIFNNNHKAFINQLMILIIFLLFVNCEEPKVDNCITDMQIKFICKDPGADVVVFEITSNYEPLRLNLESFDLIEVAYNDQDVYRASAQFELEKVSRNEYILTWMTPYFAQHGCHTEKEFYDFYEKNETLKIVLSNGKDKFTFVKCTK